MLENDPELIEELKALDVVLTRRQSSSPSLPTRPSSCTMASFPGIGGPMIELDHICKTMPSGERQLQILDDVCLSIPRGQFACIVGPSGSGKSTLLGLMAGIDHPTGGNITVDGQRYGELSEDDLSSFRGRSIGIVFQSFHLIPTLTALENVTVPLELLGRPQPAAKAEELLARVGLFERKGHYPIQLSGGEQQRVAVARAFAIAPVILLADEPTGNLDTKNGEHVMSLLEELHDDFGTTLIVVTHERYLAQRAQRVVTLVDGRIASDEVTATDAGDPSSPSIEAAPPEPESRKS